MASFDVRERQDGEWEEEAVGAFFFLLWLLFIEMASAPKRFLLGALFLRSFRRTSQGAKTKTGSIALPSMPLVIYPGYTKLVSLLLLLFLFLNVRIESHGSDLFAFSVVYHHQMIQTGILLCYLKLIPTPHRTR